MTTSAQPRAFYDGATLHVRTYDSMLADRQPLFDGEQEFYMALTRRAGGRVLEVGVGTGRIGVALAQSGLFVTGLDLSPEMLALATAKATQAGCADRLDLVAGDMRDFLLPDAGRFDVVLVPFRAFQVLLTPQDQRAALRNFHRHLRPGGLLALHLFDPNLDYLQPDVLMQDMHGTDSATGRPVQAVMQSARFDYVAQTRHDRWCYSAFHPDGSVAEQQELDLVLRWTWRWEMHHLLTLEHFIVEANYSDFLGAPPAYAREQIFVARAEG